MACSDQAPTAACPNANSDYVLACLAMDCTQTYFEVFLSGSLAGCKNIDGATGLALDIAYSPAGLVTQSFSLYVPSSSTITQVSSFPFNLGIQVILTIPTDFPLLSIQGLASVYLGGDVSSDTPANLVSNIFSNKATGFNLLLTGEAIAVINFNSITFGLIPALSIPLKVIDLFVTTNQGLSVSGSSIPFGMNFLVPPVNLPNTNVLIQFISSINSNLEAVLGSAYDNYILNTIGSNIVTQAFQQINQIISDAQALMAHPVGFGLNYNFDTSGTFVYYISVNFDIDGISLVGPFGASCSVVQGSQFTCSLLIPNVNLAGLGKTLITIAQDGEGYLLYVGNEIKSAVLGDVWNGLKNVWNSVNYQLAAEAVNEGKAIMNTLKNDAQALANGLAACGTSLHSTVENNCQFSISWPPTSFPSNPSDWQGFAEQWANLPTDVGNVVTDLGNCVKGLAENIGNVADNLEVSVKDCVVQDPLGTCEKEICIPFLTWSPSFNCCCVSIFGKDICSRPCAPSVNNCKWKICVWDSLSIAMFPILALDHFLIKRQTRFCLDFFFLLFTVFFFPSLYCFFFFLLRSKLI